MDLRAACREIRLHRADQVEVQAPGGSGLAAALDRAGTGAIPAFFADGVDAVELEDGEVSVRAERVAGGIRARVRWASGETVEQVVPWTGARPVDDVVAALHDRSRVLSWRDGAWFDGAIAGAELVVPALSPETLGAPGFRAAHGVKRNYIAGAMAGGIASAELVEAMGRAGYIGFFGAGGLGLDAVEAAVRRVTAALPLGPAGFNLLHNPAEPAVEEATVDLYLAHGVRAISASAFLGLTPAVVRFRLHGIHEADGRIVTPNRVLAKVSRPEVAEPFLRPAPAKLLAELVARGALTARQAELARRVPVAEDVTAEADSGGHTDRRPLPVLVPLFRRLADRVAAEEGYPERLRVGAAGGLGDPWALAAAWQLGADYVLTGSINQATAEAGTSAMVKEMLLQAGYADVTQGPAPDMFELGADVQVLGRGTMYAQRAGRLRELYRGFAAWEEVPAAEREKVEKQIFQRPFAEVWAETERYWSARDPRELERAAREPRHRMALAFRWYLGMTSRWARAGEAARKRDFQVWCGPAMGLFNDWVRGTWLEPLAARGVVAIADSLLEATCIVLRVGMVRAAGIPLPARVDRVPPPTRR